MANGPSESTGTSYSMAGSLIQSIKDNTSILIYVICIILVLCSFIKETKVDMKILKNINEVVAQPDTLKKRRAICARKTLLDSVSLIVVHFVVASNLFAEGCDLLATFLNMEFKAWLFRCIFNTLRLFVFSLVGIMIFRLMRRFREITEETEKDANLLTKTFIDISDEVMHFYLLYLLSTVCLYFTGVSALGILVYLMYLGSFYHKLILQWVEEYERVNYILSRDSNNEYIVTTNEAITSNSISTNNTQINANNPSVSNGISTGNTQINANNPPVSTDINN